MYYIIMYRLSLCIVTILVLDKFHYAVYHGSVHEDALYVRYTRATRRRPCVTTSSKRAAINTDQHTEQQPAKKWVSRGERPTTVYRGSSTATHGQLICRYCTVPRIAGRPSSRPSARANATGSAAKASSAAAGAAAATTTEGVVWGYRLWRRLL